MSVTTMVSAAWSALWKRLSQYELALLLALVVTCLAVLVTTVAYKVTKDTAQVAMIRAIISEQECVLTKQSAGYDGLTECFACPGDVERCVTR